MKHSFPSNIPLRDLIWYSICRVFRGRGAFHTAPAFSHSICTVFRGRGTFHTAPALFQEAATAIRIVT